MVRLHSVKITARRQRCRDLNQCIVAILPQERDFQECFERAKGSTNPDCYCHCYFSQRAVSRVMTLLAISKDGPSFQILNWCCLLLSHSPLRQILIQPLFPRRDPTYKAPADYHSPRPLWGQKGNGLSVQVAAFWGGLGCNTQRETFTSQTQKWLWEMRAAVKTRHPSIPSRSVPGNGSGSCAPSLTSQLITRKCFWRQQILLLGCAFN